MRVIGLVKKFAMLSAAFVVGAALAGCGPDSEDRELQYMPDMYRNPALDAQEEYTFFEDGSGMRNPPEGTVPRGHEPYPYGITEREKARNLENPLPRTEETLKRGQKYFNIHCRVCHGVTGAGDGYATVAQRENGMPIPPELYSDKIRNEWSDGEIFHVSTVGQGQMPAYGSRIDREDRWAIVHYVRALGIAANPSEEDVERAESLGWTNAEEQDNPYRELGPQDQLFLNSMEQEPPQ